MSRQTESGTIVEFWDTPYVPKYGGNAAEPQQLSLVDQELIYNGLEKLVIKAAGDTTGVQTSDIFSAIERPDYNQPFPDIVHQFISRVNTYAIDARADNVDWEVNSVKALGPTRSLFFVPQEVVRGSTLDGYHRNEKPLLGIRKEDGNDKYLEYPSFQCANRRYRFLQAPTFPVPDWDGKGPRYHQLGVSELSVEARLHFPRYIWPGHRTPQEDEDARLGRIRYEDCFLCRSFEILQDIGLKRFRKKSRMRHSGLHLPNTSREADPKSPRYTSCKGTQTEENVNADEEYLTRPARTMMSETRKVRSASASPGRKHQEETPKLVNVEKAPRKLAVKRAEESTPMKSRPRSFSVDSPRQQPYRTSTEMYAAILKTPPLTPKGERGKKKKAESEEEKKRRLKRDGQALYNEILQDEDQARREHEKNKKDEVFHKCPHLNWDYKNTSRYLAYRRRLQLEGVDHDTTESDIELTEVSCNSTCECSKHKKILKQLNSDTSKNSSFEDSRYNSSKTPQSTYLYTTCPEDESKDSPDSPDSSQKAPPADNLEKPAESNTSRGEAGPPSTNFEPRYYTLPDNLRPQSKEDEADVSTNLDEEYTPLATQAPSHKVDQVEEDVHDVDEAERDEEEDNDNNEEKQREEDEEEGTDEEEEEEQEQNSGHHTSLSKDEIESRRNSVLHLKEVNTSGVQLDLNLLPENTSVLGYSPRRGVRIRTTSMDHLSGELFSTEEVQAYPLPRDDEEVTAADEEDKVVPAATESDDAFLESLPPEAMPFATPKKSSPPKRPHSSPFKTASKPKKQQTEKGAEKDETQDLTFTQQQDVPDYLTSRDWERQLKGKK